MEREKPAREASLYMDGSGSRLVVRGHRGILEYSQQALRLRLNGAALVVEGQGMTLEHMDGEDIAVAGSIDCVRLVK